MTAAGALKILGKIAGAGFVIAFLAVLLNAIGS